MTDIQTVKEALRYCPGHDGWVADAALARVEAVVTAARKVRPTGQHWPELSRALAALDPTEAPPLNPTNYRTPPGVAMRVPFDDGGTTP